MMARDWAERNRVTAQSPLADRIKALKGAKVAVVGPRAANDDLLRFMLVTYGGLSPDRDVEIVNLGASPSYPPALEAKRIDAFVGASPAAETSIVRGQGISLANLMTGEAPELRGQLFVASIVRRDSIERQREQVAAAMRALARAQKLIGDRPDEAKRVLRENKFDAIAPEVWDLAWQNNLPGLATSPLLDEKGYQINFALLDKAREDKTPEIPFTRISDNSLAQEAVRAIAQ
ncbi:MAG: ABC transporter substrate-binding protein [Chloroflexi bacterium]|nr:ABC transporter substrate-binding protein [Chloroflexota bacterium]